jgi:hypothetical protein
MRATDTANNDAATRATEGAPDEEAPSVDKGHYAFARYITQADHYMGLWEEWTKALLFLMRKQWLKFNHARRRYQHDTDVPAWRQQPVNPLVYAVYRSAIAKLIKQRPVSEVVAPSNDSEDLESAKLGEAVLHHLYRALKRQTKNKRYLGWLLCTGNAAARVFWNPELGRVLPLTVPVEIPDPEDPESMTEVECPCDEKGEPYLLEDGTPDLEHEPIMQAEGDVDLVIENMLGIRWDPDAESLEDATECFIARVWPKQKVKDDLGLTDEEIDGTKDDELEAYLNLHSSAAAGADDILGVSLGSSLEEARGQVYLVLEYFRDKCDDYPQGRHWIQVGKTVVGEEGPLPNGFWPPVVMAQDTPIPGQLHAIGLIPQCVPINEQYNYLDGKILEHGVQMAMGGIWFVAPEDKGMVISTDPGQVKVSKGYGASNRPPVQAKMEALPDQMYEERNRKLELLQFVAGTNDIGVGQKPEGVASGRGFLVLQEVVDSLLMPTLLAFEEASEEIDRRSLLLVQRHYREERVIKIKGEQGKWQIRSFKGSDLVEGLDVRVQTGSSFPWSKSAKMDTALSLLEKLPELGMNNEGRVDPVRIQKILDVGGMGVFQSEGDPDAQEIDREHGMFEAFNPEKGSMQLPQLGFWQAHPVHLERHFDFIKQSYMRITRWHPAAQQAFLDHVLMTVKAVDQIAEQMAPPTEGESGDPSANGGAPPAKGGGNNAGMTSKGKSGIKKTDLKVTRGDRAAAGQ